MMYFLLKLGLSLIIWPLLIRGYPVYLKMHMLHSTSQLSQISICTVNIKYIPPFNGTDTWKKCKQWKPQWKLKAFGYFIEAKL